MWVAARHGQLHVATQVPIKIIFPERTLPAPQGPGLTSLSPAPCADPAFLGKRGEASRDRFRQNPVWRNLSAGESFRSDGNLKHVALARSGHTAGRGGDEGVKRNRSVGGTGFSPSGGDMSV
ncbi:hypothetical protein KOW79_004912 [Hemibagrus wyckioides]|uniref:Uncharacterized protein n=1 Tax=Hemibagrus wyckioides TaxID=337641 RepID=A0A9D3P0Z7_9TELE|nr:hypothetical protein KOW79_004912 [Hemibagrus wyckioides]